MAEKPSKKRPFYQKLMALMMLLTGGAGIGGWQFKDYPIVGKLLAGFTDDHVNGETSLSDLARTGVRRIVDSSHDFSKPGVYEIRIDDLRLDPKSFKDGQTLEIQARVRSIDSRGFERIAWDSSDLGSHRVVVGRDELSASWTNRPFRLGWAPGEVLIVEVYGKRMFRDQVFFRTNMDSSSSFPLKSGTQTLINMIDDTPAGAPENNRVLLTSQRVGERPNGPVVPDTVASEVGKLLR